MNTTNKKQLQNETLHTDHHTLPSVLVIGTDSNVLAEGTEHRKRMVRYASVMRELHIIVLGATGFGEDRITVAPHVYAYPTHTTSRTAALLEGFRIGRRIVATYAIDIISTQDPFETALIGYLLRRQSGARLQIQEHGDFFSQPFWRRERLLHMIRYPVGLWLVHRAGCIRVVSERIKSTLVERGIPEGHIVVIPIRTEIDQFLTAAPDPTIEALRPEGGVLLLTIARLVPQKNLPLLFRAFRNMLQSGIKARLVVMGQGSEKQHLLHLAQDLVPEQVTFLDWTDNPAGAMRAADIYVLSSDYEGWGRVSIEALAAGTPLIMTDVGCAQEIVRDGENGLVVPVRDEVALTKALKQLCTDASLRRVLAKRGQETAKNLVTKDEHLALYKKSLQCCIVSPSITSTHVQE